MQFLSKITKKEYNLNKWLNYIKQVLKVKITSQIHVSLCKIFSFLLVQFLINRFLTNETTENRQKAQCSEFHVRIMGYFYRAFKKLSDTKPLHVNISILAWE